MLGNAMLLFHLCKGKRGYSHQEAKNKVQGLGLNAFTFSKLDPIKLHHLSAAEYFLLYHVPLDEDP